MKTGGQKLVLSMKKTLMITNEEISKKVSQLRLGKIRHFSFSLELILHVSIIS